MSHCEVQSTEWIALYVCKQFMVVVGIGIASSCVKVTLQRWFRSDVGALVKSVSPIFEPLNCFRVVPERESIVDVEDFARFGGKRNFHIGLGVGRGCVEFAVTPSI